MRDGFIFPPPPPPPPKAAADLEPSQGPQHDSQSRCNRPVGNSRGQRGVVQSNWQNKGSSNSSHWQSNPAQYGNREGKPHQQPHSATEAYQSLQIQQPALTSLQNQLLPPGTYVNPIFPNSYVGGGSLTSHQQPGQHEEAQQFSQTGLTTSSPPRTSAGHKRKLESLRGPSQRKTKPSPHAVPPVPSFSAPILPEKLSLSSHALEGNQVFQSRQKPISKSLGLTPGTDDPQYSSSESEGENEGRVLDEEVMYAELGNKLTFEHNGAVVSLSSEADLAAWKMERQKNWPTRARMAEKVEERCRKGDERKRLLAGAVLLRRDSSKKVDAGLKTAWNAKIDHVVKNSEAYHVDSTAEGGNSEPKSELERAKRDLSVQTSKLEELRKKVAESEARNRQAHAAKTAREAQNAKEESLISNTGDCLTSLEAKNPLGDGMTMQQIVSHNAEHSADIVTRGSSSEPSSEISSDSSSSDTDSDNDAPEEIPSTQTPVAHPGAQQICKFFSARGFCRYEDSCQFRHELSARNPRELAQDAQGNQQRRTHPRPPLIGENSVKKSISQRLMEQEQAEEDRLVLQVVKHLGRAGLFTLQKMDEPQ